MPNNETYPTTIPQAYAFLERVLNHLNDKCGLLGPMTYIPEGNRQHRCYNTAFYLVANLRDRLKVAA